MRALAVMVMVVVVLLLQGAAPAWAGPNGRECRLERRVLVNACKVVLYGRPPTPECCVRIRRTHIVECVCPAVTPKVAPLIDVNRFVKLLQGCGRQVPRHFKCGSEYTLRRGLSLSAFSSTAADLFSPPLLVFRYHHSISIKTMKFRR